MQSYQPRFNTSRPRGHGRHFPDDVFKYISLNENVWISIKISQKFVPKGSIYNIPSLIQIMARWQQAIIWTNDGLGLWCIYTSLSINELSLHPDTYNMVQGKIFRQWTPSLLTMNPIIIEWYKYESVKWVISNHWFRLLGPDSICRCNFACIGNLIVEIRWLWDCLYIESHDCTKRLLRSHSTNFNIIWQF